MNSGDIAWVLVLSSLIMLMSLAVGLFYGEQVFSIAVTWGFAFVMTFVRAKAPKQTRSLCVGKRAYTTG